MPWAESLQRIWKLLTLWPHLLCPCAALCQEPDPQTHPFNIKNDKCRTLGRLTASIYSAYLACLLWNYSSKEEAQKRKLNQHYKERWGQGGLTARYKKAQCREHSLAGTASLQLTTLENLKLMNKDLLRVKNIIFVVPDHSWSHFYSEENTFLWEGSRWNVYDI